MATGTFCGTGAWATAPKPGDPEGIVTLTATPAFGGIDVEWTLPGINPEAVAYVNIYRSTNLISLDPVLHTVATGSFFYDKTTSATAVEYAYWIELVSINGTVGDRVGPATAIARPPIAAVIEGLTAQINDSMLAQSLKGEIDKIDLNYLEQQQALVNQAATDDTLAASFSQLQAFSDETRAIAQEEVVARTNADDAFVSQLNTTQVQMGQDIATVQTNLESEVNYINGDLDTIGAKFTVKTDVNGLVGGFGTYNDGTTVEAGFDVDRFWIGRTSTVDGTLQGGTKPFIIEGTETFIKEAVIQKLTFDKLRAADGSLIVENGKIKADFIRAKWAEIEGVSIGTADIQNGAISNAKIGSAQVDTLQLAGQAVTFPVHAYVSGQSTYSGNNALYWRNAVSAYINSSGAPISVLSTFQAGNQTPTSSSHPHTLQVRITRDGVSIYHVDWPQPPDSVGMVSLAFQDTPGAGGHTYRVQMRISGDGYFTYEKLTMIDRSLVLLETKR